jgi:hypothetical protein
LLIWATWSDVSPCVADFRLPARPTWLGSAKSSVAGDGSSCEQHCLEGHCHI